MEETTQLKPIGIMKIFSFILILFVPFAIFIIISDVIDNSASISPLLILLAPLMLLFLILFSVKIFYNAFIYRIEIDNKLQEIRWREKLGWKKLNIKEISKATIVEKHLKQGHPSTSNDFFLLLILSGKKSEKIQLPGGKDKNFYISIFEKALKQKIHYNYKSFYWFPELG